MWFTFVTARLFHSLSIQPRLAATLLSSCSVANSPTRRVGLSPTLRPASLAQAPWPPVHPPRRALDAEPPNRPNTPKPGSGNFVWVVRDFRGLTTRFALFA